MASDPRIRASDADRDRTAALLREHHAAGRLTAEEFNERLDKAYAAKTLGDLDQLLSDLPGIDLYHLPDHSVERRGPTGFGLPWLLAPRGGGISPAWRAAWGSWASVSLVVFVIWLITAIGNHSANGLWFLWVAGPWGAVLLGRWLFGTHPGGPGRTGHGPPGRLPHELRAQREADRQARRDQRHHGPPRGPMGPPHPGPPGPPQPGPPGPGEL
jgi:hypothetical protein